MFAGVAAIILNEDNTIINGIASREGEEASFFYVLNISLQPTAVRCP